MSVKSEVIRILNEFIRSSKRITDLPSGTFDTSTLFEVVNSGQNYKITGSQLNAGAGGMTTEEWAFPSGAFPTSANVLYIATADHGVDGDPDYVATGTWFIANTPTPSGYNDFNYSYSAPPDLETVLTVGNDAGGSAITNLDDPTDPQDAATKAYVDSQSATVADASETVKGVVEEATDAQTAAGTATGETGAKLFVTPAKLITWWNAIKAAAIVFTSSLKAKQIAGDIGTLTDASTVTWDANSIGNSANLTIGGNRTLAAITNPLSGGIYRLRVVQDGTGGRTLAFNAAYTASNGITLSINSGANAVTDLTFRYNGTTFDYLLPNQAHAWAVFNEALKKLTLTGADTSTSSYALEVQNSAASLIMRLSNGQFAEFGGSAGLIEILAAVASGDAKIRMNDNQALGLIIEDKGGATYMQFRSTNGDEAVVITQKYEENQGKGFTLVHLHIEAITNSTASAHTILHSITLAANQAVEVLVSHFNAYATDGSYISSNPVKAVCKRDGSSNTTGANDTINMLRLPGTLNGSLNFNIDDTNERIDIRFQNESGTGKTYHVKSKIQYIIRNIPV